MSAEGVETQGDNRGGDGDCHKWHGLEIGDELFEECKGGGEGWRWGVGDIGDDTWRSLGGVLMMGEGHGLCSSSACASCS